MDSYIKMPNIFTNIIATFGDANNFTGEGNNVNSKVTSIAKIVDCSLGDAVFSYTTSGNSGQYYKFEEVYLEIINFLIIKMAYYKFWERQYGQITPVLEVKSILLDSTEKTLTDNNFPFVPLRL